MDKEINFLENFQSSLIEVFITHNYSIFKILDKNRHLKKKNVERLVESLKIADYQAYQPLLVSKYGHILDGQHRFEACKILNLPIHFIVYPEDDYHDVIERLNCAKEKWVTKDYLHFHAGEKNVQKLVSLKNTHSMPTNTVYMMIQGGHSSHKTIASVFQKGLKFQVDPDLLDDFYSYINEFIDYLPLGSNAISYFKHTPFLSAVLDYYKHEKVDNERLMEKLKMRWKNLTRSRKKNQIKKELKELYNYNAKSNKRIFLDHKGNIL